MSTASRRRNFTPVWLSAFVWPGAGQLYSGRKRKGIVLIVLSALLTLVFSLVAAICVLQAPPADPTALLDPEQVRLAFRRIAVEQTGTLVLAACPVAAVWFYAILDAWRDS